MGCNQTVYIPKPTSQSSCGNGCGSGVLDCCEKDKLSPRPNRNKIIAELQDIALAALGAPVLDIELDQQQLDIATKMVLSVLEDYAPRDYYQYYVFNTIPGKSVYEMPPDVGIVRNVNYRETPSFAFSSELGGSIPVEYFYPGGSFSSMQGGLVSSTQPIWGRIGEWQLYKMYENTFAKFSSNIGGFEIIGNGRTIKLYPIPCGSHCVIVHYLQRCKDWDCVKQVMWEGLIPLLKQFLGRIRSKITNPPGPGGGVQMDGASLIQEGKEEYEKWKEDLIYKFGEVPQIIMG